MSVRLALTTVIQMLHALTLWVALSVCVSQGSQAMVLNVLVRLSVYYISVPFLYLYMMCRLIDFRY